MCNACGEDDWTIDAEAAPKRIQLLVTLELVNVPLEGGYADLLRNALREAFDGGPELVAIERLEPVRQ